MRRRTSRSGSGSAPTRWPRARLAGAAWCVAGLVSAPATAAAQAIDLSHGGQITVTAAGGFDWDQKAQTVTAYRDAQAVRGTGTVTADRLVAFYRKKAGVKPKPPTPGQSPVDNGGANEIYRLEAFGHVHLFTTTDQAFGDYGVYDIDQAVLVLTGHALRLTTPTDVLTARDVMEYWSQTRMSVGRGDAVVTTNDGRRIRADVLVGYSAPPDPAAKHAQPVAAKPGAAADPIESSGKLQKVNAFGHVVVRTRTETVTGERGVYVPDTGIARIVGNVHITRGQNQLNGAAAIVNMHTGLATMTEDPGARVQGLIVPNDAGTPGQAADPKGVQKPGIAAGHAAAPAAKPLP